MLESIVSQSAISRQVPQDLKDVGFFFSKQQFHPNKSLKLRPKTHLLGFKNEYCI